jgi:hypothetical protein
MLQNFEIGATLESEMCCWDVKYWDVLMYWGVGKEGLLTLFFQEKSKKSENFTCFM